MSVDTLTDRDLDRIFREARTVNAFQDRPVSDALLEKVYDVMKFGPTSANCCPLRIVFVKTKEGKERLKPLLSPGNVEKTMAAPVTALFAYDLRFHEHLKFLFPHADARAWFEGNESLIGETAFRNSALQAAYFMIAARALGLDCGPMSGFDAEKLNGEFFPDGRFRVNFICNLGYGDHSGTLPRSPRFNYKDVCQFA